MRRLAGSFVVTLALIVLMVTAGAGSPSRQVAAATVQATEAAGGSKPAATLQATEASAPEATQAATETQPTEAPTDTGPVAFNKAPAPNAGTIGISLGDSDTSVRLQTVLENGPAAKAGLEIGDEVVAIDGKPVKDRNGVVAAIVAAKPGDTITFTVNRKGNKQDIKVTVSTRRAVYCPLTAPTGTAGKPIAKDPLGSDKNWMIEAGGSDGIRLGITDSKLAFQNSSPGGGTQWVGLATLKHVRFADFIYSVDVTQSSQSVAGVIFNHKSDGFYLLQLIPNGSWQLSAFFNDGSSGGALSFSEPDLKAAPDADLEATVTNTVSVQVQDNNVYISFNGKFVCGTPLTQFGDPPLTRGAAGVFAIVYNDLAKELPTFGNVSLTEVVKK